MSTALPTANLDSIAGLMTRRTMITACAGAGLTGLYALYSQVVTPWVTPGRNGEFGAANPMPAPPPPPENIRMAQEFLPSQPWAATAKYQVRTAEAFVYANEWEPAESDQAVRFRPFAMIFLRENKASDEAPITVVGESAYIKFEKKFSIADPDPGRVIAGALQGTVRITGPDGMAIAGRNFVYSESAMRLWSDDKVQFAFGLHRGLGHGLQVELIADETAVQSESIAVTGVQSIRLRRNVAMDLVFEQGKKDRPADSGKPDSKREPIHVRVRSAGTFEFDIEANVATFSDNVRVYRPTGAEEYDSLQCDQLTLMLEPDDEAKDEKGAAVAAVEEGHVAPPPESPDPSALGGHRDLKDGQREGNFRNLGSKMAVRRARARGKHVVLMSETNNLTAHMTDLIYDVQKRVASLTTPAGVQVTQGASEIRSPGITLLHDEDGKLSSIWCQGPGWLRSFDPKTRAVQLAAQWMRQLRKYPEPESGLDVIELEQQALVRQPEQKMGLAANFIRLWIEPQELRAARPGESRTLRNDEVKLKRMLALNDVALVSREMNAETERLEVMFEPMPPKDEGLPARPLSETRQQAAGLNAVAFAAVDDPLPTSEPAPSPPSFDRATRPNSRATVTPSPKATPRATTAPPPVNTSPTSQNGVRITPAATPKRPPGAKPRTPDVPLPLRTGSISIEPVTPAGAETKPAAEARSSDAPKSDATKASHADAETGAESGTPPKPSDSPLRTEDGPIQVFSDLIRVRVLMGKTQDETHVAEVWTEGNVEVTQEHESGEEPLVITGDKLHVENRSKVDQVLHVSAQPAHIYDRGFHIEGRNVHLDRGRNRAWVDGAGLLQLPVNSTLEGEKLDKPQLLDVWWKERMTFDGEFANFYGDVRSVLNDSRMTCQQMEVTLTARVSFTANSASRDVKVRIVDCRDGVEIDSTAYVGNKLMEVRRGQIARFTLDQSTGNTHAHGPGYLTFWRRGNGRRAGLGAGSLMPLGRAKGSEVGGQGPGKKSDESRRPEGSAPTTDHRPLTSNSSPTSDSSQWEYTRVDFAGKADGNVQQRFTTFEDRVQVVYGPVERPLVTIDPDALPKDGGWMRSDKLRLQQHETPSKSRDATAPKSTHIELLGSGNAELEGRTFHARADTISYDESKGLYVLRSFGNRQATITRQKQVGGDYDEANAQRMEFVPSRNQLKLDRTTGLNASQ